jgi:TonB family protein
VLLDRGRVVTQCRVVGKARRLGVRQNRTVAEARVAREDRALDLCELEILPPGNFDAPPIRARSIDDVRAGDVVYAVGATNGSQVTTTKARVAGLSGAGDRQAIRISARLASGFAGGGIFDPAGALIGIAVLRTERGKTVSFAYPVERVAAAKENAAPQPAERTAARTAPAVDSAAAKVASMADPGPRAQPVRDAQTLGYHDAMTKYLADVVRVALNHAAYPEEARQAKWTGTSSIRFRLAPGGLLIESGVEKSSGYDTLDVAALLAVRSAIEELVLPPFVKERGMTGSVLITFQLPDQ